MPTDIDQSIFSDEEKSTDPAKVLVKRAHIVIVDKEDGWSPGRFVPGRSRQKPREELAGREGGRRFVHHACIADFGAGGGADYGELAQLETLDLSRC